MTERPDTLDPSDPSDTPDGATDAAGPSGDANMESADTDTITDVPVDTDEPNDTDTMSRPDTPSGPQPPSPDPRSRNDAPGGPNADLGLVRDPHATFGGVASGIAHRYGWSVPLVRLGFVAGFLASGGAAFVLYLVAWLIIPRARFWPPTRVTAFGGGVRSRDLGIGVAILGVLAFLIAGDSNSASFLVPLALVLGGIWLLIQDSRMPSTPTGAVAPGQQPDGPPPPVGAFTTQPGPIGQPVKPRSRSKWVIRALIALMLAAVLAAAAAVAGFVFWAQEDGFQFEFSTSGFTLGGTRIEPESPDEVPDTIESDLGFVDIDLTNLEPSDFTDVDVPVSLSIDIGEGEVFIDLPEWLDASLVAEVEAGDIDTDGADLVDADASSNRFVVESDDPQMDIVIQVENGDIDIDSTP